MAVPYTFATATTSIPLSQLDSNFATPITLGNTAIQLGNTVTTLNNMTMANVTISSVASTFPNNYLANSTATLGNATITLGGTTSTVGNLTLTNATISSGTYSVTNATVSGSLTLSGGTANGVAYLNGSNVLTTGSALTFDGTTLTAIANGFSSALTVKNSTASQGVTAKFQNDAASGLTVTAYGSTYASGSILSVGAGGSALDVSTDFGLNAANTLRFGLGYTEQMRLTSTGLGIGTSSPGNKLEVNGGITTTADASATNTIGRYSSGYPWALFRPNSTATGFEFRDFVGNAMYQLDQTSGNQKHLWYTAGAEKMRLDSSGNLGLGVTPSAWTTLFGIKAFDISNGCLYGATNDVNVVYNAYFNGTNFIYKTTAATARYTQSGASHAWYSAASGTAGNTISFTQAMTLDASSQLAINTTTIQNSSAGRGNITLGGSSSTIFNLSVNSANSGSIYHSGTEMWFHNRANGPVLFFTNDTERARIDSSGNLLVGTTNNNIGGTTTTGINATASGVLRAGATDNASLLLNRINSDGTIAFFQRQGTTVGTISVTGSATAYNTSSDYRLKENIQPMQNALGVVAQLNPVTYNWKVDGSASQGFIAHELQAVVPDCVTGEKDAVDDEGNPVYQGIDTSFLVATLTAAIQEQQAIITDLRARVAQLESKGA